jgi:hypothetical protein
LQYFSKELSLQACFAHNLQDPPPYCPFVINNQNLKSILKCVERTTLVISVTSFKW